jgi:uncharacterized protein DUF6600
MGMLRLRTRFHAALLRAALAVVWAASARAQSVPDTPAAAPAHIAFVEGTAQVEHDGEWEAAVVNLPLLEGDRIVTTRGRVDILWPDGSTLAVDRYSEVVLVTATRVDVVAGSTERHDAPAHESAAADLPAELQIYDDTLSRGGSWQDEAPYGRVWYPRVASAWRPYSNGYWAPMRSYGWTWVGADAFAWPTQHYGRWGHARGGWFWMPGRAWAPAWVAWAAAPGYVSWCPLGPNGSPVFPLSIGSGNPWAAWTIVRRDTFGNRRFAAHRATVETRLFTREMPFIVQSRPPVALPSAAERARADAMRPRARAVSVPPIAASPPTIVTPPPIVNAPPMVVPAPVIVDGPPAVGVAVPRARPDPLDVFQVMPNAVRPVRPRHVDPWPTHAAQPTATTAPRIVAPAPASGERHPAAAPDHGAAPSSTPAAAPRSSTPGSVPPAVPAGMGGAAPRIAPAAAAGSATPPRSAPAPNPAPVKAAAGPPSRGAAPRRP